MDMLRRIGSGIVFVVAVISCLLALIAAFGIWYVRSSVEQIAIGGALVATGYLDLADTTIQSIDGRLTDMTRRLSDFQTTVAQARGSAATDPRVTAITQTTREQIIPTLESLANGAERLEQTLELYNQNVNRLNRVPLVTLPTANVDVPAISVRAADIRAQIDQLQQASERFDGTKLLEINQKITSGLSDLRAMLTRASEVVRNGRQTINTLQTAIIYWSLIASIVTTPMMLIFAAGQVSLAAHAWGWMRRPASPSPSATTRPQRLL